MVKIKPDNNKNTKTNIVAPCVTHMIRKIHIPKEEFKALVSLVAVELYKMHLCFIVVGVLITSIHATNEKINLETLNNYSEFLNFGVKKLKLKKESLENAIIKSKVDVLGEIFKRNIDSLKHAGKLEVLFLIDASSSVGKDNFRNELKFVKKLLSDVTVDYNHTRVAIVTFSSSVVSYV